MCYILKKSLSLILRSRLGKQSCSHAKVTIGHFEHKSKLQASPCGIDDLAVYAQPLGSDSWSLHMEHFNGTGNISHEIISKFVQTVWRYSLRVDHIWIRGVTWTRVQMAVSNFRPSLKIQGTTMLKLFHTAHVCGIYRTDIQLWTQCESLMFRADLSRLRRTHSHEIRYKCMQLHRTLWLMRALQGRYNCTHNYSVSQGIDITEPQSVTLTLA